MVRVVVFLLLVVAIASGLSWLADRPGSLLINWQGYEIRTSVFRAVVLLALVMGLLVVTWSILRGVWHLPAGVGDFFNRRREKRGLEALSSGLLAIGSGDRSLATRYAVQARKSLPNEPLTHILRAQAAQMAGDRQTARRIFESMLGQPQTEAFGLRGLFLEAEREGEAEAARQFAQRALEINPRLTWPVSALFDAQCKTSEWAAALKTLAIARKHGQIEKPVADRRRAVLLTAQAQELEDSDPEHAMKLAEEAHQLAPDLIPATAIAGRLEASRGNVRKATKILERGWRKQPHPDIATAYAYARIGDSPRDRLNRAKKLAALSPHSIEAPIAIAHAAIEAHDFETARSVLMPLTSGRLTQRVCTLMARIESEDGGNVGAVREWLARAVNAPRDPAWTADGIIADDWAPVSPVTGALDAFQWRVPVETAEPRDSAILAEKIEELVKLGVSPEAVARAAPSATTVVGITTAATTDVEVVDDASTSRHDVAEEARVEQALQAEVKATRMDEVAGPTEERGPQPSEQVTLKRGTATTQSSIATEAGAAAQEAHGEAEAAQDDDASGERQSSSQGSGAETVAETAISKSSDRDTADTAEATGPGDEDRPPVRLGDAVDTTEVDQSETDKPEAATQGTIGAPPAGKAQAKPSKAGGENEEEPEPEGETDARHQKDQRKAETNEAVNA